RPDGPGPRRTRGTGSPTRSSPSTRRGPRPGEGGFGHPVAELKVWREPPKRPGQQLQADLPTEALELTDEPGRPGIGVIPSPPGPPSKREASAVPWRTTHRTAPRGYR